MTKLYALLVGVDEYHPDSGVRNLKGCVNDVEAMHEFLTQHYTDYLKEGVSRQIKYLLDEEATRRQLIESFTDQLIKKPREGDIALFYFSGHGSHEPTSEEFERFDGRNQNETLVCYDSRLPGHYDLADKELAVLINQIPEGVQKVVILDSCHSGSATRSALDADGRIRQQPGRKGKKRPLNSYFLSENNYYTRQKKTGDQVSIPLSRHILLAACDRRETALETNDNRGLFSTQLLKVLEEKQTVISYNQLFLDVRRSVLNERPNQNPRVDAFAGFNGNQRFLGLEPVDSTTYPINWDATKNSWVLEQGAVHGLPTDPMEVAQIGILVKQANAAEEQAPVRAGIQTVKIDQSYLEIPDLDTSGNTRYEATINTLPAKMSMRVALTGDADLKTEFLQFYQRHHSPYLELDPEIVQGCTYEVRLESDGMRVIHIPSDNFIVGANTKNRNTGALDIESCVEEIAGMLRQIEQWERLCRLEKEPTHIPREAVRIQLQEAEIESIKGFVNGKMRIVDKKLKKVVQTFPGTEMRLGLDYLGQKDGVDQWSKAGLRIVLENHSDRNLYFHLLYFSRKYKIVPIDKIEIPAGATQEHELYKGNLQISSKEPDLTESIDIFKVITSTEELTPTQFTQDGFKELGVFVSKVRSRDLEDEEDSYEAVRLEDWFTTTFTVTVAKNLAQISDSTSADINGIRFAGNPKLKATVTLGGINARTRSTEHIHQLPDLLKGSELQILDFSRERSDLDQSIIELNNISGEEELAEHPLEIQLDAHLLPDELNTLVPVTFDGEFIIPVGSMQADGKVLINHMPTESRERSIGRAFKFVFLKSFFKDKIDLFQLAWYDYSSNKKDKRVKKDLVQKVAAAQKILLVTHGIIGNTHRIAPEAEFAQKEKGFDLVLTYDYENLDTPINEIAENLDKDLQDVGLGSGHQKELYIVAGSMGGLVCRHLIEQVRKDDGSVKRLIMLGTPNGGSRFGDLPGEIDDLVPEVFKEQLRQKARAWFDLALGIALNFLPGFVNSAVDMSKKLVKLIDPEKPNILETLVMMSPESDFIKDLKRNAAPKNTQYFIVAGTIESYQIDQDQNWFGRFLEKVKLGVGKVLYFDQPNDIAVGTKEILEVKDIPKEHTETVTCHHLVYFTNEESVACWKQWL